MLKIRRALLVFWKRYVTQNLSGYILKVTKEALECSTAHSTALVARHGDSSAIGFYCLAELHRYSGSKKPFVEHLYKCALVLTSHPLAIYGGLEKFYQLTNNEAKRLKILNCWYLHKPSANMEKQIVKSGRKVNLSFKDITTTRGLLEQTVLNLLSGRPASFILKRLHSCLSSESHSGTPNHNASSQLHSSFNSMGSQDLQFKLSTLLPATLALFAFLAPEFNPSSVSLAVDCINMLTDTFGYVGEVSKLKPDQSTPPTLHFEEVELAWIPSFHDIRARRTLFFEKLTVQWVAQHSQANTTFDDFQRIQCIISFGRELLAKFPETSMVGERLCLSGIRIQ